MRSGLRSTMSGEAAELINEVGTSMTTSESTERVKMRRQIDEGAGLRPSGAGVGSHGVR